MSKYIDKEKLINAIESIPWYHIGLHGNLIEGANSTIHTPLYKADDIYKVIDNISTVGVDMRGNKI